MIKITYGFVGAEELQAMAAVRAQSPHGRQGPDILQLRKPERKGEEKHEVMVTFYIILLLQLCIVNF